MDLAIINTCLITFQNDFPTVIEDGAIGIDMDKISFVGKSKDIDEKNYGTVIDGSSHVTMPGLVDAHIHTGLSLLRGTAQDVPEKEWMNKALGPLTAQMGEKDFITGSKLGVIEGIKSGTTTFAEFTSGLNKIIKNVYLPFNARVIGAETINEVTSREGDTYRLDHSRGDLKEKEKLFHEYRQSDLVEIMYGPQALDMVSLETLHEIKERSEEHDRRIHMHVAQGEREKEQIKNRYDCTTVEKLEKEDMLHDRLLAAHCHSTTQDEKERMVKNDVKMVGCPSSIGMIDGEVPPIDDFLSLGGTAALGSDQIPGNGSHNIFREMRTMSLLSKCREKDPSSLPPWKALRLATRWGAEAIGMEKVIGTIEVGKKADVITIDLKKINLIPTIYEPFRNIIPNLVYSTTGLEVDTSIINGNVVLKDGKLVNIDEKKIKKEAEARAKSILSSAEEDWLEANSSMVKYHKKMKL